MYSICIRTRVIPKPYSSSNETNVKEECTQVGSKIYRQTIRIGYKCTKITTPLSDTRAIYIDPLPSVSPIIHSDSIYSGRHLEHHRVNLFIVRDRIADGQTLESVLRKEADTKTINVPVIVSYITDKNGYIPSFPIYSHGPDFKYKKFIRECIGKEYGYKSSDILDIKLWSTRDLNHTYMVLLQSNREPMILNKESLLMYRVRHIVRIVFGKQHKFVSRAQLYQYLGGIDRDGVIIGRHRVYEIANDVGYTELDIWNALSRYYGE